MHDRTGWTRGASNGDVQIKNNRTGAMKTYKNLVEFKRPCAMCGEPFAIYVTRKIANGEADSNSFGLKNCEQHRRSSIREVQPELETLRTTNATMKSELAGLYERGNAQFGEIQELKARLAKYELQPAMEAAARPLAFPWEKT